MKRKKGLRSLTVLLSFFIFFFPAYSCYFTLSEMNLSSADMGYESPDQDGMSMNPQNECRGFVANFPPVLMFSGHNLFKLLFDYSCQTTSIEQSMFILRC